MNVFYSNQRKLYVQNCGISIQNTVICRKIYIIVLYTPLSYVVITAVFNFSMFQIYIKQILVLKKTFISCFFSTLCDFLTAQFISACFPRKNNDKDLLSLVRLIHFIITKYYYFTVYWLIIIRLQTLYNYL